MCKERGKFWEVAQNKEPLGKPSSLIVDKNRIGCKNEGDYVLTLVFH